MIFRQLFDSTSGTYTYLLASRHGGEALIIDPVLLSMRQRQWKPTQVFCPKLPPADGFQTTARAGCDGRIKPGGFPPCGFIATAMDLAMVSSKNGMMNSSLTVRPSARLCAKRRAARGIVWKTPQDLTSS
jgi:hypothetical protein